MTDHTPSVAVIACGALGPDIRRILEQRGVDVELHLLPALLHNRPAEIAPAVEELATRLQGAGKTVALGYADCGTYGALDAVCERLGLERLAGLHCYDLFAGSAAIRAALEEEPGTYLLTDFLVRTFRRTVSQELGLDRWPELKDDYFGNYERVVWLAQGPVEELRAEAEAVAALLGLPLEIMPTGRDRLASAVAVVLQPHEVRLSSGAPGPRRVRAGSR